MTDNQPSADGRIEQARALLAALEQGDDELADRILDEIGRVRETLMFQEVGKLTRQLHDTLANFSLDEKIADLTEKEIPDAKERLNYVITMTEQAANTTLNAVESILPFAESLHEQSNELGVRWQRFRQREMPYEEFKSLTQDLADYFDVSAGHLQTIQGSLTEVLMAQGFQDLTGQIIRRVIKLVQDLEHSMVDLIRISGRRFKASGESVPEAKSQPLGPAVPGVDKDTVHSQDDVDSLLSSLGF
ncbi:protein phosphatase CheZ [Methylocaldum sp.]|uniref:protein phosphatase CheZ n=1 Tax=Methylocaldum sp. TaxID=1969727 RepID=UPI002D36EA5D|nr:protein phosphatase CheZ [Methylocaldum sp.]HYE36799.1 protein phosphatase CheZ [Methylocaldum sp.]